MSKAVSDGNVKGLAVLATRHEFRTVPMSSPSVIDRQSPEFFSALLCCAVVHVRAIAVC